MGLGVGAYETSCRHEAETNAFVEKMLDATFWDMAGGRTEVTCDVTLFANVTCNIFTLSS